MGQNAAVEKVEIVQTKNGQRVTDTQIKVILIHVVEIVHEKTESFPA